MKNKWLVINIVFLFIILIHSILRDIEFTKRMPCDLRNRVVGARLQKIGISPYFYHWHPGESTRFVDPQNILLDSAISNMTASPFFHQLLYPVSEYSQRSISFFELIVQYSMLAFIILICYGLTNDIIKKVLVVNIGILFTLTEAWKSLISAGQLYFFCAFLMICIIRGMRPLSLPPTLPTTLPPTLKLRWSGKLTPSFHSGAQRLWAIRQNKTGLVIAGICMAAFILTRPIAIIALVPLLPFFKPFRVFFITAFTGLAVYLIFVAFSPFEKYLWKDYSRALEKHVEMHQIFDYAGTPLQFDRPVVATLEGFDLEQIDRLAIEKPMKVYSETGNFFVIYYMITKKKLPLTALTTMTVILVAGLLFLFFYRYRKYNLLIIQTLLFSFALYMIVELSNPIHRFQYNTTQWFPLVLIGIILCRSWKTLPFILLVLGLMLNIVNIPWILIRHTIGEYCWMIALLIISMSPIQKIQWKQP